MCSGLRASRLAVEDRLRVCQRDFGRCGSFFPALGEGANDSLTVSDFRWIDNWRRWQTGRVCEAPGPEGSVACSSEVFESQLLRGRLQSERRQRSQRESQERLQQEPVHLCPRAHRTFLSAATADLRL